MTAGGGTSVSPQCVRVRPHPVRAAMHKVLIIDDNKPLCRTISKMVDSLGMESGYETTLRKGLHRAAVEPFDVVFLDVNLPDGSGLDGIARLRKTPSPPEIVIITGYGDEHGAEAAIRSGAWDYIVKNASLQNIRLSLTRAIDYRTQKKEKPQQVALKRDGIVGQSPAIAACLDRVAQAANSDTPVLITGRTGTGKELFARAVHENSLLFTGNFVVVDCAALPEYLVESILFGHKKGAFTGADSDQAGLIRQADNGTLFLDEIGELPLNVQKKFLRIVQEKRVLPVGSKQELACNFRLVCATHRDLAAMVDQGRFRQDLYYRIRSIQIELPPLRERAEDIPALVISRIARRSRLTGGQTHGLSPDFLEALMAYSWPGNVRELFNTLDGVLAEAFHESTLFPTHLPAHIRADIIKRRLGAESGGAAKAASTLGRQAEATGLPPLKQYIETMKRRYIRDLIQTTGGDIRAACRISGLSRAYLYQLLNKYNLT